MSSTKGSENSGGLRGSKMQEFLHKIPSMMGVWIFSGTTQQKNMILVSPLHEKHSLCYSFF